PSSSDRAPSTPELLTLSLHDALPISRWVVLRPMGRCHAPRTDRCRGLAAPVGRRGPRGRDRAIVPPWLRRTWFPLQGGTIARSRDRKSTRLNSSHQIISYAVFCLKKK